MTLEAKIKAWSMEEENEHLKVEIASYKEEIKHLRHRLWQLREYSEKADEIKNLREMKEQK